MTFLPNVYTTLLLTSCEQCVFKIPALCRTFVTGRFSLLSTFCWVFHHATPMPSPIQHTGTSLFPPSTQSKQIMERVGLTLIIALVQAKLANTVVPSFKEKPSERRIKVMCFGCHRYFYIKKKLRRHCAKPKSASCLQCVGNQCSNFSVSETHVDNICTDCGDFCLRDYQHAAIMAKQAVAANCLLTKNIRHDLYEKDPKERILSETVSYSLQKLEAFNRHTDNVMNIIRSPINPKMFFDETETLIGIDGNKESRQFLEIQNREELLEIVSRHYF